MFEIYLKRFVKKKKKYISKDNTFKKPIVYTMENKLNYAYRDCMHVVLVEQNNKYKMLNWLELSSNNYTFPKATRKFRAKNN